MSSNDYNTILNIIGRYCHIVDRAGIGDIVSLYWDDATLDFLGGIHTGRDAIARCYAGWIDTSRTPVLDLRHKVSTAWIDVHGDFAASESYVDADGWSRRSLRPVVVRGMYQDRFARRDGEWRLLHRKIVVFPDPNRGEPKSA